MNNFNFDFTHHKASPCKGCQKRTNGCHSTCNGYLEYKIANEEDAKKDQIRKCSFAPTPLNKPSTIERISRRNEKHI